MGEKKNLNDLIHHSEHDFLPVVYDVVLGRAPDSDGLSRFDHALKTGQMDRYDVIIALCRSEEAKAGQSRSYRGLTGIRLRQWTKRKLKFASSLFRSLRGTLTGRDSYTQINELRRNLSNRIDELERFTDSCTADRMAEVRSEHALHFQTVAEDLKVLGNGIEAANGDLAHFKESVTSELQTHLSEIKSSEQRLQMTNRELALRVESLGREFDEKIQEQSEEFSGYLAKLSGKLSATADHALELSDRIDAANKSRDGLIFDVTAIKDKLTEWACELESQAESISREHAQLNSRFIQHKTHTALFEDGIKASLKYEIKKQRELIEKFHDSQVALDALAERHQEFNTSIAGHARQLRALENDAARSKRAVAKLNAGTEQVESALRRQASQTVSARTTIKNVKSELLDLIKGHQEQMVSRLTDNAHAFGERLDGERYRMDTLHSISMQAIEELGGSVTEQISEMRNATDGERLRLDTLHSESMQAIQELDRSVTEQISDVKNEAVKERLRQDGLHSESMQAIGGLTESVAEQISAAKIEAEAAFSDLVSTTKPSVDRLETRLDEVFGLVQEGAGINQATTDEIGSIRRKLSDLDSLVDTLPDKDDVSFAVEDHYMKMTLPSVENLIKEEFSASSVALDVEQEFELLRQRVESLDDEKVGQQDLERIISDSRELITHTTTANFEPFEKGMIERIGSLKEEALRWVNETNDKIRSLLVGQADQAAFVRESNDRIHEIIKAHLSGDRVVHAQDVDEVSRRLNDELYQEFEDRYRGSEDEIKRRLQPYVDIIREGNKGTISTPVLDIGCGRGEWLDLLKENGFVSEGVDVSPKAVERSQRKGLRVTCADGVEYLAGIDDNSVGVITAFHVVEHLTFNDLQTFLRVAHRKLSSGGFIILETPNPENVQVGTNWFYTDPTHIRPMTPDLLKFLVEYTGFGMTDVLRLNPIDAVDVKGMGFEDLSPGLMRLICGERDFSVVARKVSR